MAVDVTAFSAMARAEFQNNLIEAYAKPIPADIGKLVDEFPSKVKVETHSYMSNIPRLRIFKGYTPGQRLTATPWTVENKTYRCGPVTVQKDDLDDDQIGGYLRQIAKLPQRAQKDIKYLMLKQLAAGDSNKCFDGTAMFADAHTIGTGDNLMTVDNASNDGLTHKIIAVITDGPAKPLLFQDREPLKDLHDDYTPQAMKQREFEYWADTRFGMACAAWFTSILITLTDTPTLTELDSIITSLCNRFRMFYLPKGSDVDDAEYFHEGWVPMADNFTLLCSMGIAQLLDKIRTADLIAAGSGGGVVTNQYQNKFDLIPTSSLGV
jgi:phage major head subunit gpT-like protein